VIAGLAALASLLLFIGFVSAIVWAAQHGVEDGAAWKPAFMLCSCFAAILIALLNSKGSSQSFEEKRASTKAVVFPEDRVDNIEEFLMTCASRCKCCCLGALLVLMALSGLHSVLSAHEKMTFYPEPESLYQIEGHDYCGCTGSGEQTIFLHHGWGGNSLDFERVRRNLSIDFRV